MGLLAPMGGGNFPGSISECDRNRIRWKGRGQEPFSLNRLCGLCCDVGCARFLAWLSAMVRPPSTVPRAGWWVLLSGVGSVLGFLATILGMNLAIGAAGGEDGSAYIMLPGLGLAFASAGVLAGAFQWIVLRSWACRAGWWLLISSASWAVAGLAYLLLTRGNDVAIPLGGAVSGALSGGITGLGIVWLLRARPEPL